MRESRNRAAVSPNPRAKAAGWVLEAVFPNGKQATIAGFGSESEANEWLGSASHVAWLRASRSAFLMQAVVAAIEHVSSCTAVLMAASAGFLRSARQRCEGVKKTHPALVETLPLLLALALAFIAGLTRRVSKWARARRPVCWRSVGDRCLSAATVALLAVSAGVALLVAVVVILGRSEQPPELNPVTPNINAARPVVQSRSSEATEISDPIAGLIDRVSAEPAVEVAAQESAAQPAGDDATPIEIPAAAPRHDLQRAAPPGIVGVWAPQTGSCSARNPREGVLTAVISERGARAGKTSCVFKNQRRIKGDWRLLANCTNGREHWKSNVQLAVKGDRLIWTSERGTQAYIRCRPNA